MLVLAQFAAASVASLASVNAGDSRPIYHYRRTNGDGSEPEEIFVLAEAPGRIAVMKQKSRCTNAAYVTAVTDTASGQTLSLVGGRLTHKGTQDAFAWLVSAQGGSKLEVRLGSPEGVPKQSVPVGPRWHAYDFDFADMAAHPPAAIKTLSPLSFELPLILATDAGFTFTNLGRLNLHEATRTRHFRRPAIRYRASGAAGIGRFWFDARSGVLLEVRLPRPNHSEYRDFRLRLISTAYGEKNWNMVLADHWRGCPVPKS